MRFEESAIPKSVHTPAYKIFLEFLRSAREAQGLSQRELGRRLNQHHGYVNKCETGERQLNIVELRDWCRALGLSWTDFVQEVDEALQQAKQ